MFFDRDQNARRERQIAYRNQLKEQIEMKNSKLLQKNQRPLSNQPQTFSLLKNIEIEEQNRKKRQQNFYSDLQNQIELEKQQKKRRKQEEARRQLEQEQKIKKDLEMLRQRAELEKLQQQKKKAPPKQQNNNQLLNNTKAKQSNQNISNNKRISLQQSKPSLSNINFQGEKFFPHQQNINAQNNFHSRLKTSQSQRDQNQLPLDTFQVTNEKRKPYGLSSIPTYVNRVENEAFNFLPQRKYMNSYFEELLGEKKKFEHEAASISELNRILYQEKSKAGKIQSRGLGELRKLQMMLDEKGANYMAGFSNSRNSNQFDSLRKISIPTFQNSRVSTNNTGWRKLD